MCKIGWFHCPSVSSTPCLVWLLSLKPSHATSQTAKQSAHVQTASACKMQTVSKSWAGRFVVSAPGGSAVSPGPAGFVFPAPAPRVLRSQLRPARSSRSSTAPCGPRYSLDSSKWLCSVRELVLSAAFSKALPKKLRQEQKYEWAPQERMFTKVEARNSFLAERWKRLPDVFTGAVYSTQTLLIHMQISLHWRLWEMNSWAIQWAVSLF